MFIMLLAGAVAKYCNVHFCMCVCLCMCLSVSVSVCLRAYLPNLMRNVYQFFVHVAYHRGSVLLCGVTQSQGAILAVLFPIHNALHSIAFGTHTKTVEPIEILFGLMTCVGFMYHVLDGGPDPTRLVGNFGGNVEAHCKVMGHSTVRCAKTAEPIDMLFCMRTQVGPRNHVLDRGANPLRGRGSFWGCPGHSNALAFFAATVAALSLQKDHSIANNIM